MTWAQRLKRIFSAWISVEAVNKSQEFVIEGRPAREKVAIDTTALRDDANLINRFV